MSYITETRLRNLGSQPASKAIRAHLSEVKKSAAKLSIFLSHSHKDTDLVNGILAVLGRSSNYSLFIDWQNSDMPDVTNRETASKIKQAIKDGEYFMVLATANALASRWVPWEIGVADILKPTDKILLIPIANQFGTWNGNEYLQLYNSLELSDQGDFAVFQSNEANDTIKYGELLQTWLDARASKLVVLPK